MCLKHTHTHTHTQDAISKIQNYKNSSERTIQFFQQINGRRDLEIEKHEQNAMHESSLDHDSNKPATI